VYAIFLNTTVHRVRQFLGLTGYFRKFVANYAVQAKPLSYLLQKDVVWEWGEEQSKAFEILKESLIVEPVLTLFKPTCDVVLYTDASSLGLAGTARSNKKKNQSRRKWWFEPIKASE
jgi:hypothetical protein